MQGHPNVLKALDDLLAAELAAINTYFVHARLQDNWGYKEIAQHTYAESIDEMKHAQVLIDRIIYLDAIPNLNKMGRVRAGEDVPGQFAIALELEVGQRDRLTAAIATCRDVNDEGTRVLLDPMVADGETTIDWLETQIGLIEALGAPAYLAQQLGA